MGDNGAVTLDALVEEGIAKVLADVECVSAADRKLIARMEQTVASAQAIGQCVSAHLAAVYGLQAGDAVDDDGCIVRGGEGA